MSELTDQALDGDIVQDGMLARAVYRVASGEAEFEGCTFQVDLSIESERNGKHGEGDYYKVTSRVQNQPDVGYTHTSKATRDRDEAEGWFEDLLEKYDLEASVGDGPNTPDDEKEPRGLLARLRARCGFCSTEEGETEETEVEDEEADYED